MLFRIFFMNQGVQGKCIAIPTRTTPFSKEKRAALGGTRTHDTLLSRQSALPTGATRAAQLSLQHNTTMHAYVVQILSTKVAHTTPALRGKSRN